MNSFVIWERVRYYEKVTIETNVKAVARKKDKLLKCRSCQFRTSFVKVTTKVNYIKGRGELEINLSKLNVIMKMES